MNELLLKSMIEAYVQLGIISILLIIGLGWLGYYCGFHDGKWSQIKKYKESVKNEN